MHIPQAHDDISEGSEQQQHQ